MFHSESAEKTKDKIISDLGNPQSDLRIIIATSALGMGVDIQGFHSLVLYGPPLTTVDLIQGIGVLVEMVIHPVLYCCTIHTTCVTLILM